MSLEGQIYNALKDLVSGRVYPDTAPEGAPSPYIVYQAVGGAAINYVEAAIPDKQNARVQVSVWSDSRLASSEIGKLTEDALRMCLLLETTVLTARRSLYDPTTSLRGCMQDFSFWY